MNRLRLAVIGAGRLGRFHARLAESMDDVELVGVVDPVEAMRVTVAEEMGTRAFTHHSEIFDQIDAAVVAVPSRYHHAVGMELLDNGIHLLIEKPIATTLIEAADLVDMAERRALTLQVGHIERFNPALTAVHEYIAAPRYIEAVRTSGYTCRSTDIGVVLDLMIHDLDIALNLIDSELADVQATGSTIFGPHEDKAEARLTFENGAVANLRASRVSHKAERAMRIECERNTAYVDFGGSAEWVTHSDMLVREGVDVERLTPEAKSQLSDRLFDDYLPLARAVVESRNALSDELRDFVESIGASRAPRVTGRQGRDALEVAELILTKIAMHADGRPRVLPVPHWNQSTVPIHRKAG